VSSWFFFSPQWIGLALSEWGVLYLLATWTLRHCGRQKLLYGWLLETWLEKERETKEECDGQNIRFQSQHLLESKFLSCPTKTIYPSSWTVVNDLAIKLMDKSFNWCIQIHVGQKIIHHRWSLMEKASIPMDIEPLQKISAL